MDLALSVYEGKASRGLACVLGRKGPHRFQVMAQAVPGLLGSKVELCPPGPWAVALTRSRVCAEGAGTASSQAWVGLTPRVWGLERSREVRTQTRADRREHADVKAEETAWDECPSEPRRASLVLGPASSP